MPEVSDTELLEATENLRRFIKTLREIHYRMAEEERQGRGDVGTKN